MHHLVDRAELGYIFGRASWGRGIATEATEATEAADACIWYGFEHLGFNQIGAGALRDNTSSQRALEKH
jgi:RimJ/RimL family protein N-acetyltransferase